MGRADLVTHEALNAAESCDQIFVCSPIPAAFANFSYKITEIPPAHLPEAVIKSRYETIGVMALGDISMRWNLEAIKDIIQSYADCQFIAGVGFLQYMCAKMGIHYEGVKTVHLEKKGTDFLIGHVSYNEYVFVSGACAFDITAVCPALTAAGLGFAEIIAGLDLSTMSERIVRGTAEELAGETFDKNACMIIKNPEYTDKNYVYFDANFYNNENFLPEEIRCIALSKLRAAAGDVIWDIGEGSAVSSIELARKAYGGIVYAVSAETGFAEKIRRNKSMMKGFNVVPVEGEMADALSCLPRPDKVLIENASYSSYRLIPEIFKSNPSVKGVCAFNDIESLNITVAVLSGLNIPFDVKYINVSGATFPSKQRLSAVEPAFIVSF